MAGKADMTIHGWRQLIEWSIEHSCMHEELKAEVQIAWKHDWAKFCQEIVNGKDYLLGLRKFEPNKIPEYWRKAAAAKADAEGDTKMSGQ